jgi:polyphosphate kinase
MTEPKAVRVSIGDNGAVDAELNPVLSEIWIDRDLSWIDFNQRVLAEAVDDRTPLLERAKFLAIFSSNLDEFFMKRIAVIRHAQSPDSVQLHRQIRDKLTSLLRTQAEYFRERLIPELARHSIHLRHWEDLTGTQKQEVDAFFDSQVSAAVTPLVFNAGEDFPFLSNLSNSLIFSVEDPTTAQRTFGRIKVPPNLSQWVQLYSDIRPGDVLFVRLYEIVCANLHKLYRGMKLGKVTLVRLSREIEVVAEEDEEQRASFTRASQANRP